MLLAEDNAVNQLLMRTLLEEKGWSVTVAEDGRAAVAALGRGTYDVVLMDVQMPFLDGYEATRAIRDLERAVSPEAPRHVGIIGLTAHAFREDRERCFAAGMDDFLAKPVDPEQLFAAILRNVGTGGRERRGPAAELNRALLGSPPLLRRITEEFFASLPRDLADLREAATQGRAQELAALAHSFAGSLLVLGARRAATAARRLEACGREGDPAQAGPLFDSLLGEVARLKAFLEELVPAEPQA